MRILTLTNWYPPHHRGGYELNCEDVSLRMAERGHRVQILCSDQRLAGAGDDGPLPVRRELKMYWRDELPWAPGLAGSWQVERHNQRVLTEVLDDFRPDVVSVWHMAAMSLNLLTALHRRRIPLVYAICDAWPCYAVSMDPWSSLFNRSRSRRVAGRVIQVVVRTPAVLPDLGRTGRMCFVSEFTRDQVRANSPWAIGEAPVIPSGIDRQMLRGETRDTASWKWNLAYFGRFDPRKGTETLVRALPRLPPEARLTMFGRGGDQERQRLASLASELGVSDRLEFGFLDRHQLGDAYRAADCIVFPSEWPEPFGLVPLEAMECGVPVVATGIGGSAEFLQDGVNCLLFEPADPSSLASALALLASDEALRQRLTAAGRETAAAYDVDRMAAGYEEQFLAVAGSR